MTTTSKSLDLTETQSNVLKGALSSMIYTAIDIDRGGKKLSLAEIITFGVSTFAVDEFLPHFDTDDLQEFIIDPLATTAIYSFIDYFAFQNPNVNLIKVFLAALSANTITDYISDKSKTKKVKEKIEGIVKSSEATQINSEESQKLNIYELDNINVNNDQILNLIQLVATFNDQIEASTGQKNEFYISGGDAKVIIKEGEVFTSGANKYKDFKLINLSNAATGFGDFIAYQIGEGGILGLITSSTYYIGSTIFIAGVLIGTVSGLVGNVDVVKITSALTLFGGTAATAGYLLSPTITDESMYLQKNTNSTIIS